MLWILIQAKDTEKYRSLEVTVQGNVRVDMLFLDLDFFNRLLAEEGTDIHKQVGATATIKYSGIEEY